MCGIFDRQNKVRTFFWILEESVSGHPTDDLAQRRFSYDVRHVGGVGTANTIGDGARWSCDLRVQDLVFANLSSIDLFRSGM